MLITGTSPCQSSINIGSDYEQKEDEKEGRVEGERRMRRREEKGKDAWASGLQV